MFSEIGTENFKYITMRLPKKPKRENYKFVCNSACIKVIKAARGADI